MVKPPSFDSNGMKKGAWSEDEDHKLRSYIARYGHWNWRLLPKYAGLKRCGKSCRLRWVNYLKPGVKRGDFTKEEQDTVIKLHQELGNKWSAIAAKLPGRTDNEIKNFWHTRVEKRQKSHQAAKKKASMARKRIEVSSDNSCEATCPTMPQNLTPSLSTNAQDQIHLMLSGMLEEETTNDKNECLEFDYPELHCSELSSSGSSYINNWAGDDDDQLIDGSFWNEVSTLNASIFECESSRFKQQDEGLLYYDALPLFDYEMHPFC